MLGRDPAPPPPLGLAPFPPEPLAGPATNQSLRLSSDPRSPPLGPPPSSALSHSTRYSRSPRGSRAFVAPLRVRSGRAPGKGLVLRSLHRRSSGCSTCPRHSRTSASWTREAPGHPRVTGVSVPEPFVGGGPLGRQGAGRDERPLGGERRHARRRRNCHGGQRDAVTATTRSRSLEGSAVAAGVGCC